MSNGIFASHFKSAMESSGLVPAGRGSAGLGRAAAGQRAAGIRPGVPGPAGRPLAEDEIAGHRIGIHQRGRARHGVIEQADIAGLEIMPVVALSAIAPAWTPLRKCGEPDR